MAKREGIPFEKYKELKEWYVERTLRNVHNEEEKQHIEARFERFFSEIEKKLYAGDSKEAHRFIIFFLPIYDSDIYPFNLEQKKMDESDKAWKSFRKSQKLKREIEFLHGIKSVAIHWDPEVRKMLGGVTTYFGKGRKRSPVGKLPAGRTPQGRRKMATGKGVDILLGTKKKSGVNSKNEAYRIVAEALCLLWQTPPKEVGWRTVKARYLELKREKQVTRTP